jgi:hypothetical protein
VSQSSGFCLHNPLRCFSTSIYCCLFRCRLSLETFGYTLVQTLHWQILKKSSSCSMTSDTFLQLLVHKFRCPLVSLRYCVGFPRLGLGRVKGLHLHRTTRHRHQDSKVRDPSSGGVQIRAYLAREVRWMFIDKCTLRTCRAAFYEILDSQLGVMPSALPDRQT